MTNRNWPKLDNLGKGCAGLGLANNKFGRPAGQRQKADRPRPVTNIGGGGVGESRLCGEGHTSEWQAGKRRAWLISTNSSQPPGGQQSQPRLSQPQRGAAGMPFSTVPKPPSSPNGSAFLSPCQSSTGVSICPCRGLRLSAKTQSQSAKVVRHWNRPRRQLRRRASWAAVWAFVHPFTFTIAIAASADLLSLRGDRMNLRENFATVKGQRNGEG